jgi:hypothetical protein
MMALIFFSMNLTSFKTPTRLVRCDFSGLIFGDLTDSQADSAGSIPVIRHRHPPPKTVTRYQSQGPGYVDGQQRAVRRG